MNVISLAFLFRIVGFVSRKSRTLCWGSASTRSGHVEPSTLKKQHAGTFKMLNEQALKNNERPIRPFELYSLRHTFLTRLGQSGCNVWTLARIAGHSSIAMSARYVHPSEDVVLSALEQLQAKQGDENKAAQPALPAETIVGTFVESTH